MSSVRKRTLPSGEVRWLCAYKDGAGERRFKQFRTKAEAVSFETKMRAEVAAGVHVSSSQSVTVREAGDLWLDRAKNEGLEESTCRQYEQHLKHHILPELGHRKLCDLTKPAIEAFRDALLQDRSRPLTRAILTSLKGILKEAMRRGLAGQNVAAETTVKTAKRHKKKVEIPSKDEIRAILSKSAELWPITRVEITRKGAQKIVAVPWRPLLVTALFTGLRCSELRGLKWQHVDFDEGVIHVRERADFKNRLGSPKSESGHRDVPIGPFAINTLKAWKLGCPATAQDIVFPNENGRIHSNSNIHKVCWRPLLRALGLVSITVGDDGEESEEPKYTFHHLRHAAASLFIEQGMLPKKVQTVMGHSSIQVTYDIYGHLFKTPTDDQKAMAEIEARILA